MKILFLTATFCMFAIIYVNAQTTALLHLNYSVNWNKMSNLESKTKTKFSPLNFGLAVDVEPNVIYNEHWSYSSGVFFQNKCSKKMEMNYINIPLTFNYRIPLVKNTSSLYASAGGYVAYAVSNKSEIIGLKYNKFDVGLHFALRFGNVLAASGLKIEYEYGLLDIVNNNIGSKVSNGTLFLTVSLATKMFKF